MAEKSESNQCSNTTIIEKIEETESDESDYEVQNEQLIKGTKRARVSYTIEFKLNVLKELKSTFNGNKRRCAKFFQISRSLLQDWAKKESKFNELKDDNNVSIRRTRYIALDSDSKKKRASYPDMEANLYEWIKKEREKGYLIDTEQIKRQALTLFKEYYPNSDSYFKASNGWLQKFLKRFDLVNRVTTSTGQLIPTEAVDLVKSLFARFDSVSEGNHRLRLTVVLTIMSDGKKLQPQIIFKNLSKKPKGNFPSDVIITATKKGSMNSELMEMYMNKIWAARGEQEFTAKGNRKRASYEEIVRWVTESWKEIDKELVKRSFMGCGLVSNRNVDLLHHKLSTLLDIGPGLSLPD
ncbi:pogo transposable element with KRAB domain-like protein, partial [Dinothrombium tinctorium]